MKQITLLLMLISAMAKGQSLDLKITISTPDTVVDSLYSGNIVVVFNETFSFMKSLQMCKDTLHLPLGNNYNLIFLKEGFVSLAVMIDGKGADSTRRYQNGFELAFFSGDANSVVWPGGLKFSSENSDFIPFEQNPPWVTRKPD